MFLTHFEVHQTLLGPFLGLKLSWRAWGMSFHSSRLWFSGWHHTVLLYSLMSRANNKITEQLLPKCKKLGELKGGKSSVGDFANTLKTTLSEIMCTSKTRDRNKHQIGFYCWRELKQKMDDRQMQTSPCCWCC